MVDGPDGLAAPLAVVATTEEVLRHPDAGPHLLNPVEQQRAAQLRREENRRDFVAAHLLVRLCAARLLGIDPAEVAFAQHCPGCDRPGHGRPLLTDRPEIRLSLAHTEGVVAAAAGPVPVGIDVELLDRPDPEPGMLERVLTAAESALVRQHPDPGPAFLRQWVRKEALVKIGRADLDTLGGLDLSALPVEQPDREQVRHRFEELHLIDWTDRRRGVLAAVVSPALPRLGTAAVPLSDLP